MRYGEDGAMGKSLMKLCRAKKLEDRSGSECLS